MILDQNGPPPPPGLGPLPPRPGGPRQGLEFRPSPPNQPGTPVKLASQAPGAACLGVPRTPRAWCGTCWLLSFVSKTGFFTPPLAKGPARAKGARTTSGPMSQGQGAAVPRTPLPGQGRWPPGQGGVRGRPGVSGMCPGGLSGGVPRDPGVVRDTFCCSLLCEHRALVEWNAPWHELNAPLEGGWGVNPKP